MQEFKENSDLLGLVSKEEHQIKLSLNYRGVINLILSLEEVKASKPSDEKGLLARAMVLLRLEQLKQLKQLEQSDSFTLSREVYNCLKKILVKENIEVPQASYRVVLSFADNNKVKQALALLKQLLPSLKGRGERPLSHNDTSIELTEEDYLALRKAQFKRVSGEAALLGYFKSIRLDEFHFALDFLNSVIQCQGYQKDRLRPPSTARYKITYRNSKAVIMLANRDAKLTKEEKEAGVVAYQAMYTEEQKAGLSPKQAVSLLTPETYVDVFGFNRNTAPLAGFIFNQLEILNGGYNGLYDGGTMSRPYCFNSLSEGLEKRADFEKKIHATPEEMAQALDGHQDTENGRYNKHTESLVRVRLTKEAPGKIAIFNDDQASRWYALYLQALTAGQFEAQAKSRSAEGEEKTEEAKAEEKPIAPPIYYYLPDSLKCFTEYTAEEQKADRQAAEASNGNETQALKNIIEKKFWFLMGLSKEKLAVRLNSTLKVEGVDMPVLSYLMLTGYVGLARGLAKLAGIDASEEPYWKPFKHPVSSEEKESDPHPLLKKAHPQFIGQAALHFSEQYTQLDSRLLEATDSDGETALITAARLGFPSRVEALLAHQKIDINVKDDGYHSTPLHLAAASGHLNVVNALIEKGAEVNITDRSGQTPLHLAAGHGHVAVVKRLLEKKHQIDINAKEEDNWTPLHWAAINGHVAVVTALIDRRADVNAKNNFEQIPLHLAARRGHVAVVKRLLEAKNQHLVFKAINWKARSATLIGALIYGVFLLESINPKGWINVLSQALLSQVGTILSTIFFLLCTFAAIVKQSVCFVDLKLTKPTCGQYLVGAGGLCLQTTTALILFMSAALPEAGLMTLCNNPVTAGIVLGAICFAGLAGYLSDRIFIPGM